MIQLNDFSRFGRTDMVIIDGVETFDAWTQPSYLLTRPDESMIGRLKVASQYAGRPDLISNMLYGVSSLDWVLIAFNDAVSLNWPPVGEIIEYPISSLVFPSL